MSHQRQTVQEVFEKFEDREWTLTDIAKASNIPFHTIQQWHAKYCKNKEFRPGKLIGQHKRLFTPEQEKHIAEYLVNNYIKPGRGVKRKHLRLILFFCWQQMDFANRAAVKLSTRMFSYHFMENFCTRNHLSFRYMRDKKRSEIDSDEVLEFRKKKSRNIYQIYSKQNWKHG